MDDKSITVMIADGAFDGMDQEEVDEIMEHIQDMIDSDTLFENAEPVDMDQLVIDEPDVYREICKAVDSFTPPTLH